MQNQLSMHAVKAVNKPLQQRLRAERGCIPRTSKIFHAPVHFLVYEDRVKAGKILLCSLLFYCACS